MRQAPLTKPALLCCFFGLIALLLGWTEKIVAETQAPAPEAEQQDKALGEHWLRLVRDEQGNPVAMEVAILRYVPVDLVEHPARWEENHVDLVGAVHIGDKQYYEKLNQRFREYEALLYELVAAPGTVVERGRGTSNSNPLGAMQNGLKSMLEIEHQLEQIDYTRPNFVHADLSPDQFMQSMKARDEGFMKMYFRVVGQSLAQQSQQSAKGESTDVDLFAALLSNDRPRQLKIAMAKQFESMEAMIMGISGPEGSTLITERNKRALEVLRQELDAGKKKLGIFYGAGHLSDMHERVVEDFDLVPVEVTWLEAWNLRE